MNLDHDSRTPERNEEQPPKLTDAALSFSRLMLSGSFLEFCENEGYVRETGEEQLTHANLANDAILRRIGTTSSKDSSFVCTGAVMGRTNWTADAAVFLAESTTGTDFVLPSNLRWQAGDLVQKEGTPHSLAGVILPYQIHSQGPAAAIVKVSGSEADTVEFIPLMEGESVLEDFERLKKIADSSKGTLLRQVEEGSIFLSMALQTVADLLQEEGLISMGIQALEVNANRTFSLEIMAAGDNGGIAPDIKIKSYTCTPRLSEEGVASLAIEE